MLDLVYPSEPAPVYPRPSVDNPGRASLPPGEILPLVEESGIVYGQAGRDWVHSGCKALHPVVHLHIIDRMGNVFLQKRALTKDLLPGYWDTAVGGHISYGESVTEALFREAGEELGLTAFNPAELGTYIYDNGRDRELIFMFAILGHPDLHPDNPEVSEGRWWTVQELEEAMGKDILTPNFESEFTSIKKRLLALL